MINIGAARSSMIRRRIEIESSADKWINYITDIFDISADCLADRTRESRKRCTEVQHFCSHKLKGLCSANKNATSIHVDVRSLRCSVQTKSQSCWKVDVTSENVKEIRWSLKRFSNLIYATCKSAICTCKDNFPKNARGYFFHLLG